MKQIISATTIPQSTNSDTPLPKPKTKSRRGTQNEVRAASVVADTHIRPSKELIYETPKRETVREDDDDDNYEDEFLEEDAKKFGRKNICPVARPYLMFTLGGLSTHNTVYLRTVIYLSLPIPRC